MHEFGETITIIGGIIFFVFLLIISSLILKFLFVYLSIASFGMLGLCFIITMPLLMYMFARPYRERYIKFSDSLFSESYWMKESHYQDSWKLRDLLAEAERKGMCG